MIDEGKTNCPRVTVNTDLVDIKSSIIDYVNYYYHYL